MRASISTPVGPVVAAVARMRTPPATMVSLDVDMRERERVAHGDEFRGALGGLNAGEAGDFKRVAFGICGERGEDCGGELDEGGSGGGALRGWLGADVDHAGVACGVVVRKLRLGLLRHSGFLM